MIFFNFLFFFTYIKMPKDSSDKYYQNTEEILQFFKKLIMNNILKLNIRMFFEEAIFKQQINFKKLI